ncbi:MAG: ABC transporter permease [Candidatus Pacearchaeota archaeon]
MISKKTVKYSLKNLSKSKSRSILTILSIMIGITTIFIFVSFGLGLYSYVDGLVSDSSANKIVVQSEGSGQGLGDSFSFDESDLEAVQKSSGVYKATGVYMKAAEIKKSGELKFAQVNGYNPEKPIIFELNNVDIVKGRELQAGDQRKVTMGNNYLKDNEIFSRALDVNDRIKVNGKSLTAIGFYGSTGNARDDSAIYVTKEYFEELFPNKSGYDMILANVDTSKIERVTKNIEENLRESRGLEKGEEDFYVATFEDLLDDFSSTLDIIVGFIILIAFISVIVSAINTANTMITSVLERFKEIGIMKSMGAKNSHVFGIFLFESGFLGLVAGIFGIGLGYILTYIAKGITSQLGLGFLQPAYPIEMFLGLLAFSVLSGAISGVLPAIRASKIDPVEALRYE